MTVAGAGGEVELSWTDNSINEKGFNIWRKTPTTGWWLIGKTGEEITSYNDGTVEAGEYRYRGMRRWIKYLLDFRNCYGTPSAVRNKSKAKAAGTNPCRLFLSPNLVSCMRRVGTDSGLGFENNP